MLFGQKSSIGASSSKPLSMSSDQFRKDIDTPQFRRSMASHKHRNPSQEKIYYELTQKQLPSP